MNNMQKLMQELYQSRDQERGLEKTILWLVSEIGEVTELVAKNKNIYDNPKIIQALKLELGDCLAWLLSTANLLNIDIEAAFYEKYPNVCPKCLKKPCECN